MGYTNAIGAETLDTSVFNFNFDKNEQSPNFVELSPERRAGMTARIGSFAVELCNKNRTERDINNHATLVQRFWEQGEAALPGIEFDIKTSIAERLKKTPFTSTVSFEIKGNDLMSVLEGSSLRKITHTNLDILKNESSNIIPIDELARAVKESNEVDDIINFANKSPIGAYMIVESLPLGPQLKVDNPIAINRIYKKTGPRTVEGSFVSLFTPSVDKFNKLRQSLDVKTPHQTTALGLLDKYEFYDPNLTDTDQFIKHYVKTYDQITDRMTGKTNNFGLDITELATNENGMDRVEKQPKIIAIFTDTIKALRQGNGAVTSELTKILDKLSIRHKLVETDIITTAMLDKILSDVFLYIVSVIDKASPEILAAINNDSGSDAGYSAASHFGAESVAAGEQYASNGCPEGGRSEQSANSATDNSETNSLNKAFGAYEQLKNFGAAKMGHCRVKGCTSGVKKNKMGKIKSHEKVVVGGCDVCVQCHIMFGDGKSPELHYARISKSEEKRRKRLAEMLARKKSNETEQKIATQKLAKDEEKAETNRQSATPIVNVHDHIENPQISSPKPTKLSHAA